MIQLNLYLTICSNKKLMLRRSSTHCLQTFQGTSKNWLLQRKPRRTSWKVSLVKPIDSISTLTLSNMIQNLTDHQSFHQSQKLTKHPLTRTQPPLTQAIPLPLTMEATPLPLTMEAIPLPLTIVEDLEDQEDLEDHSNEHNESARKGWTAHL